MPTVSIGDAEIYYEEAGQGPPLMLVSGLNGVLFHNLRRLRQKDFVTLSLLRFDGGGHVRFAGAHEDIVVCRAATGRCEQVSTPGTWLGVKPDVDSHTVEGRIDLEVGDLLVLYTDGLTEAKDRNGGVYGLERVIAEIERAPAESAAAIRDRLTASVRAFMASQDDDISVLVVRRRA